VCPGSCDAEKTEIDDHSGDPQNGCHKKLCPQNSEHHKCNSSHNNSSATNKASSLHKSPDCSQSLTVLVNSKQISNPQVCVYVHVCLLVCSAHALLWDISHDLLYCPHIISLQVVNLLRQKHHLKVEVCPLGYANYVVSNRMALQRVTVSG